MPPRASPRLDAVKTPRAPRSKRTAKEANHKTNEVRVDIPNTVVANHRASVYDRYKKTVAFSMLAASVAAVLVTLAASRGIKLTPKTQVPISTVRAAEKISKIVEPAKPLSGEGALYNTRQNVHMTAKKISKFVDSKKLLSAEGALQKLRPNVHKTSLTHEEMANALAASIARDLGRLPAVVAQTLVTLFSTAKP
jgi:hypothetical protein